MSCGKLSNCEKALAHTGSSAKLLHKERSISPPCVRLNWHTMFHIDIYAVQCVLSALSLPCDKQREQLSPSTCLGFPVFPGTLQNRCSAVELATQALWRSKNMHLLWSLWLLHVWVCLCRSKILFQAMDNGNNLKFLIGWKFISIFHSCPRVAAVYGRLN